MYVEELKWLLAESSHWVHRVKLSIKTVASVVNFVVFVIVSNVYSSLLIYNAANRLLFLSNVLQMQALSRVFGSIQPGVG